MWTLPELMREEKLIEVMNNSEMRISQKSRRENQIQKSVAKDSCTSGNSSWKLFQLMKECKPIRVRCRQKKQTPQGMLSGQ
jgi:hypothetical protein